MISANLVTEKAKNIFFNENNTPNPKVTFGHLVFQPGDRIPVSGYGKHEQDEYSFIIKGTAHTVVGETDTVTTSGTAMFIPAGEEHYCYNDSEEPFEVLWALVER